MLYQKSAMDPALETRRARVSDLPPRIAQRPPAPLPLSLEGATAAANPAAGCRQYRPLARAETRALAQPCRTWNGCHGTGVNHPRARIPEGWGRAREVPRGPAGPLPARDGRGRGEGGPLPHFIQVIHGGGGGASAAAGEGGAQEAAARAEAGATATSQAAAAAAAPCPLPTAPSLPGRPAEDQSAARRRPGPPSESADRSPAAPH